MFEPSGDARVLASSMWDQYQAFVSAGFNEAQAFKMVDTIIWSGIIGNSLGGS